MQANTNCQIDHPKYKIVHLKFQIHHPKYRIHHLELQRYCSKYRISHPKYQPPHPEHLIQHEKIQTWGGLERSYRGRGIFEQHKVWTLLRTGTSPWRGISVKIFATSDNQHLPIRSQILYTNLIQDFSYRGLGPVSAEEFSIILAFINQSEIKYVAQKPFDVTPDLTWKFSFCSLPKDTEQKVSSTSTFSIFSKTLVPSSDYWLLINNHFELWKSTKNVFLLSSVVVIKT